VFVKSDIESCCSKSKRNIDFVKKKKKKKKSVNGNKELEGKESIIQE
jgi:hypothetical protein